MMKWILTLLLLSYGAGRPSLAADVSNLDLRVETIQQQYCRGDNEVGFVKLTLRLTFRNVGQTLIPLFTGGGGVLVTRAMLSKSGADYRDRSYLVSSGGTYYTAEGPKSHSAAFALAPGGSHTRESSTMIPLWILPDGKTSPGAGEYWYGVTAEVLAGVVTSHAAKMRIDASPVFGQCK